MGKKLRCCICNKIMEDHGNIPYGALDYYGRPIKWQKDERCCDECLGEYVIPGRIKLKICQ